uniref:SAM domain-containing protein n=1 Tax=Romanomermis culicivorax TaxID=13658 RepID=A0A915JX81_ROMCU
MQSSSEFNGHNEDTDSMRSTNLKKNLHVTWFGTYDNVPAIRNGSVEVAAGDQIERLEPTAANVKHVEKTPQGQPEPESENCGIVTQNEDTQWHEKYSLDRRGLIIMNVKANHIDAILKALSLIQSLPDDQLPKFLNFQTLSDWLTHLQCMEALPLFERHGFGTIENLDGFNRFDVVKEVSNITQDTIGLYPTD